MSDPTAGPSPLTLTAMLREKVWGGDRLADLGKPVASGARIGESWEVADLSAEVAGVESRSVIAMGPLAGKTLHDAMELWGGDLLGRARATASGDFPLLTKYLDAREHLSVQVHPSPAYAAAHPEAHLKTECWMVIEAQSDSDLFIGIKPGVTREQFAAHLRAGTVPEVMVRRRARVGEAHLLPSGTCHALGAGVVVAEVQTPSDTTFRVYDWVREYARPERELHIDQALECIDFSPTTEPPPVTRLDDGAREGRLVTTDMFVVDELHLSCEERKAAGEHGDAPVVLMVLATSGGSVRDEHTHTETPFETGTTLVLPASIVSRCMIAAGPGTKILRSTVL